MNSKVRRPFITLISVSFLFIINCHTTLAVKFFDLEHEYISPYFEKDTLCIGIIWTPVYKYRNDIIKDIETKTKVIKTVDVELNNLYKDFVYEIYSQEHMEKYKIDLKIENVCHDPVQQSTVSILLFHANTKDQYFHSKKQKLVYAHIEEIKEFVREKYKVLISNYFFDNIFHATDNEQEFISCVKTINKYYDLCCH